VLAEAALVLVDHALDVPGVEEAPARDFLREHLSRETLTRRGLFDPGYVERMIDEHERGFGEHSALLYGLLTVELWHRSYVDASAGQIAERAGAEARAAAGSRA